MHIHCIQTSCLCIYMYIDSKCPKTKKPNYHKTLQKKKKCTNSTSDGRPEVLEGEGGRVSVADGDGRTGWEC